MKITISAFAVYIIKTNALTLNNSGLYVLINIHTKMTEAQLIEVACNVGVKVYSTSHYFISQQPYAPLIQIGFSNCSIPEIEEGIQLLKTAWSNQIPSQY